MQWMYAPFCWNVFSQIWRKAFSGFVPGVYNHWYFKISFPFTGPCNSTLYITLITVIRYKDVYLISDIYIYMFIRYQEHYWYQLTFIIFFLNNTINILQRNMGFGRELQQTSLSLHFTMKDRLVFIGALWGCIIPLIKEIVAVGRNIKRKLNNFMHTGKF